MQEHNDDCDGRVLTLRWTAILIAVLGLVAVSAAGGSVAAQDGNLSNASYYDNHSADVNNESWTQNHRAPTLANFTHYLTRTGGFVIGNGGAAQGGGSANGLIVGLMFMGAFASVAAGGRIGSVAGVVLGVAGVAGLVEAALAPSWFYAVIVFIVGALLAVVAIRWGR